MGQEWVGYLSRDESTLNLGSFVTYDGWMYLEPANPNLTYFLPVNMAMIKRRGRMFAHATLMHDVEANGTHNSRQPCDMAWVD